MYFASEFFNAQYFGLPYWGPVGGSPPPPPVPPIILSRNFGGVVGLARSASIGVTFRSSSTAVLARSASKPVGNA